MGLYAGMEVGRADHEYMVPEPDGATDETRIEHGLGGRKNEKSAWRPAGRFVTLRGCLRIGLECAEFPSSSCFRLAYGRLWGASGQGCATQFPPP